tara:strand:- start:627 stop:809 length:183 start_codon:yes stop_codon:yes gene_type:complete
MKENEKWILRIILDFGGDAMSVVESPSQRALPGCSLIIVQKFFYAFCLCMEEETEKKKCG